MKSHARARGFIAKREKYGYGSPRPSSGSAQRQGWNMGNCQNRRPTQEIPFRHNDPMTRQIQRLSLSILNVVQAGMVCKEWLVAVMRWPSIVLYYRRVGWHGTKGSWLVHAKFKTESRNLRVPCYCVSLNVTPQMDDEGSARLWWVRLDDRTHGAGLGQKPNASLAVV